MLAPVTRSPFSMLYAPRSFLRFLQAFSCIGIMPMFHAAMKGSTQSQATLEAISPAQYWILCRLLMPAMQLPFFLRHISCIPIYSASYTFKGSSKSCCFMLFHVVSCCLRSYAWFLMFLGIGIETYWSKSGLAIGDHSSACSKDFSQNLCRACRMNGIITSGDNQNLAGKIEDRIRIIRIHTVQWLQWCMMNFDEFWWILARWQT